jgi:hypothetical protein
MSLHIFRAASTQAQGLLRFGHESNWQGWAASCLFSVQSNQNTN